MDMLGTTMASVKLRLTLMPMPTPLDRLLLDSPSTTPMLLDTPHNVGVVTGTTYSAPVHHGYTAYAAPTYTGYA